MAALLLRRELPRRATGLDEFSAPTESSGQGEQVKPPEVLMSRENRFLKRGGGGFLQKEKKKGFISLEIKTKIESRKEKIEIGRELKIIHLNCYLIKQTDYSHLTESRVCLITSLKSDQLEILPVVRFFDYSETRTVHSAYVLR